MLLKIKTYRKSIHTYSPLIENGEIWITDKFFSINVWGEFDRKTYYNIFITPEDNILIDEDDFKRIYEAMNK